MGSGQQAQNVISEPELLKQMRGQKQFGSSNGVSDLLQQYSNGGNLSDILSQGKALGQSVGSADLANERQAAIDKATAGLSGSNMFRGIASVLGDKAGKDFDAAHPASQTGAGSQQELVNQLASNPMTGTKFATDQVQSNPVLGKLFGQGGALDRANSEEQNLASRGFSLKPEDYEAYGQASGDTARMFGGQEQGIANALARRGLSAAPSGAANSAMTGMMGNKYEHLAELQRGIANDRMQMNQQRLNSTRNYMQSLGSQAEGAIGNQFNRNQAGITNEFNQKAATTGQQMQSQQAQQNQLNTGFEQNRETQGPGLGDILTDAGGIALGGMTGGLSSGLGTATSSLFGDQASKNYAANQGKKT